MLGPSSNYAKSEKFGYLDTLSFVIEKIVAWVLALIAKSGYGGIFLTMTLESAAVPIPSEVVLPFSGFLASTGQLNFWLVAIVATCANLVGAAVIYYIGLRGGRALLIRYGKYFLIHTDEIARMDGWLERRGALAAFFSRLLPGLRTFSSLVLGAGRTDLKKFLIYTAVGSFVWNLPLTYAGWVTGKNWNFLQPYFRNLELLIAITVATGIIWFIYRHLCRRT